MKKDTIVLTVCLFLLGLFSYFSILHYSLNSYLAVVVPILKILLCLISILFLRKCFVWYASYMLNGKSNFQAVVDRPRVFIFSMLIPVLLAILLALKPFNDADISDGMSIIPNHFYALFLISLFLIVLFLLFKTLNKSFESLYLPKVQKIARSYTSDFTSYASIDKLHSIFDGLINYDFLSYEDLNEQNEMRNRFVEVFISGNFPSEPLLQLKMDNLQTYVLFENLAKETKDLSLTGLLKILKNKNAKPTAETITESYRKCVPENIKNRNLIEFIFAK